MWTSQDNSDGTAQASKKLRLSILRQAGKAGGDDPLGPDPSTDAQAQAQAQTSTDTPVALPAPEKKVVPPIRPEDVLFSPAVARIMAGYRPPPTVSASAREAPASGPAASPGDSLPAVLPPPLLTLTPAARDSPPPAPPSVSALLAMPDPNSDAPPSTAGLTLAVPVPTPVPTPVPAPASPRSAELGSSSSPAASSANPNPNLTLTLTEGSSISSPAASSAQPAYWSYTPPALFGLLGSPSRAPNPAAPSSSPSTAGAPFAGPFSTSDPNPNPNPDLNVPAPNTNALSPWFLADGSPDFSRQCRCALQLDEES